MDDWIFTERSPLLPISWLYHAKIIENLFIIEKDLEYNFAVWSVRWYFVWIISAILAYSSDFVEIYIWWMSLNFLRKWIHNLVYTSIPIYEQYRKLLISTNRCLHFMTGVFLQAKLIANKIKIETHCALHINKHPI